MPVSLSKTSTRLENCGWLLLLGAFVATLFGLGHLADTWSLDWKFGSSSATGLGGLGYLLLMGATGRVLLAWMPPGFPGEHGLSRRDSGGLVATWAASHALGLAAFAFSAPLIAVSESALGVSSSTSTGLLFALVAALLAGRIFTRPGAMVPRHGMAGIERPSPLARALLAATTLTALAPLVFVITGMGRILPKITGPIVEAGEASGLVQAALASPAVSAAAFAATIVLIGHALCASHLAPLLRRAVLLLIALLPAGLSQVSISMSDGYVAVVPLLGLLFTGGTALGYTALRRADRRASTLAALLFTALPFLAPDHLAGTATGLGLAGVLSLMILTPSAGRARQIKLFAACLAVTIAAGILSFPTEYFAGIVDAEAGDLPPFSTIFTAAFRGYDPTEFGILFGIIDATGLILILKRPWRSGGGPARANLPQPELAFLFAVALFGWLIPMGLEAVIEGMHPNARFLWEFSIAQLLVLLAGPGTLMVATGLPAIFAGHHNTKPSIQTGTQS